MRMSDWSSDVCSSDLFFLRIPAASLHEVGHEPGTGVVGEVVDHVLRVRRAGREQQRSRSGRQRRKHKQKTNHLMIASRSTNGGRHASVASRPPGNRKARRMLLAFPERKSVGEGKSVSVSVRVGG